jgi:hypothetical protein
MEVGFGVELGHFTIIDVLRSGFPVPGSMFACLVRVLGSMFQVRRSRFANDPAGVNLLLLAMRPASL